MTISPDGKSLTMMTEDNHRGTTNTWIAEKQEKTFADNQECSIWCQRGGD